MILNQKIQNIEKEDFKLLKKFVLRSNKIHNTESMDLIYFSYGFVKIELPTLMQDADFEGIINKLLFRKDIDKVEPQEALPFIFWVYDSLKNVIEVEKEYLSSMPDPDMMGAGIERLNELGETNLIDTLAGGDVLKWEAVKALPYHVIFDKQRKMKLESDIQKDLARIQKDKAKQRR